jgi:MFS transporter, putative metabolite:H+ symporter
MNQEKGSANVTREPSDPTPTVSELNARVDRLPSWGISPVALAVVGMCYFFAFYDISVMGVALPAVLPDLGFAESATTWPITANLIAYIVGAYGFGTLADYIGRRRALLLTVCVLAVGGLLTAFSWDLASLTVFRIISGLGIGSLISLSATIISEFSPTSKRGRYLSASTLLGATGVALPPFLGLPLVPIEGVGWRVMFGIGFLVALVIPFLRDEILPESPRWLVLHGQQSRARLVVERMESRSTRITGQSLPPMPQVPAEQEQSSYPSLEVIRQYPGRLILVALYWIAFYLFLYAFLSYEPTLLVKMGYSLPTGILFAGIVGLGSIVGFFVQAALTDRVERKYIIVGMLVVAAIGIVVVASIDSPVAVMVGSFLLGAGNYGSAVPAYGYTAEVFPTRARATGMALGDGLGHVGGAVQPLIVIAILGAFGPVAVFWWMGAMVVIALLLMLLGGKRTRGSGLTQLAE